MTSEPPVPLVVSVHRLRLAPDVPVETLSAVWVEIDLLGLDASELQTQRLKPREAERAVGFQYALQVVSGAPAAEKLRKAIRSPDEQDSDVFFMVKAATSSGNKQLGVGYVNLQSLYRSSTDVSVASIVLNGSDERRVGTVDVSLTAAEALHRAVAATSLRLCVGAVSLPVEAVQDPDVNEVFIEIDFLGLAEPAQLRTKSVLSRSESDFGFALDVAVATGSQAMQQLRKVLTAPEESESNIFFSLKTTGQQVGKSRNAERELAQGYLNLRTLLREGQDLIGHSLSLRTSAGGSATILVSLLGFEALRRVKVPLPSESGLRIELGELVLLEPLKGDRSIETLWIEVEAMDINGPTPLKTNTLQRVSKQQHFGFSQVRRRCFHLCMGGVQRLRAGSFPASRRNAHRCLPPAKTAMHSGDWLLSSPPKRIRIRTCTFL